MTITAQNLAYLQQGPVASGQQIAPSQLETLELSFLGTATFTGDAGGSTTAVLNYIDGTNVLTFTPRAVMLIRIGGTSAATVTGYAVDNADGGKSATATFSAALGSGSTFICVVAVLK
jgi:long-subunit fatty acid transport protein